MSTATHSATTDERSRRRRGVVVLKFGLAGAALLGIAAAATSAAWTDQAWFSANATGATFAVEGLNFATTPTWVGADNKAAAVVVPASTLANLVPGTTRSFDIQVRNTGSVDATVTEAHSFQSVGPVNDFTAVPDVTVTGAPATLPAGGAATTVHVVVSAPTTWDPTNKGKSEDLVITFTGTVGS